MEFGIFMLLAGILFGICACYDEIRAIREAVAPQESASE